MDRALLRAAALPLAGFVMLAATLAWGAWMGNFPAWLLGMGAASAGLILAGGFVQHAGSLRDSVLSLVYSLFVVLAMLFAYLLAANNSASHDITRHKVHTLSAELVTLLRENPLDLEVVVFAEGRNHANVDQFLGLAARESPRLRHRVLDPTMNPAAAAELGENIAPGEMFITALEEGRVLRRLRTSFDPNSPLRENAFYGALTKVIWESDRKIYFTTGHGERALAPRNERDDGAESLRLLAESFTRNVMPVEVLDLRGAASVPADAAAVIIANPTWDLFDNERDILLQYLNEGGALMIMADPVLRQREAGGVETLRNLRALSRAAGVDLRDEVVIDPRVRQDAAGQVVASVWFEHPINEASRMEALWGRFVRPLEPFSETGSNDDGITREGLFATTPDAFSVPVAEVLRRGGNVAPPTDPGARRSMFVAIAASRPTPGGLRSDSARAIVMGDSDWATDRGLPNSNASSFAIQSMNWLIRPRFAFSISPREMPPSQINIQPAPFYAMAGGLLLMGLAIVAGGAGFATWRKRRS